MAKQIPKPSILDDYERISRSGERRWRNEDGSRIFTWDSLHGEVEVFDRRGMHLGALDPVTGELVKEPVKGRRINVS
jgi:hypothetical protein